MPEVSIAVPIVLSGKAASGNVFLERAVTRTVSKTGARIVCKQALAAGDVVALLLPEQDRSCGARVVEAGRQPQEFVLEMDSESQPFWSMLYTAAKCVAPTAPAKPAEGTGDRFSDLIREAVEVALDLRLEHVMGDLEKRPASHTEDAAQTAAFENRMAEAMERMWQELGRRFTAAGVTYEKRMNELAEERLAEFEARLAEAIKRK